MKIRLIGSSVGGAGVGQCLSSYVVDDRVAIDAGALGFYGSVADQSAIRHVFLTHSHQDHVASLPILLDNVYGSGVPPIIHAAAPVLASLQSDLFNNRVWPDFIGLSKTLPPFLELRELTPGVPVELPDMDGLKVTALPVDHVVPCVAYLLERPGCAAAIVTDTRPVDDLWQRLAAVPDLKLVFLECAFPDEEGALAKIAKHLTPSEFRAERAKFPAHVQCVAMHVKPRFHAEVVAQLQALCGPSIAIAEANRVYCI